MSPKAIFGTLVLLAVLLAVGIMPQRAAATHYPDGALCYDCHAISASKMIKGTHLLKYDDRAVALGMSEGSPTVRCLYCHADNILSMDTSQIERANEMKPVMEHFTAASLSKHSVKVESTFSQDPGAFDCLDCHTGISASVSSDGSTIHLVDASVGTVDKLGTLIGDPATVDAVCSNTSCHGGTGNSYGGLTAAPAHNMGSGIDSGIRLEDGGPAPAACTDCHHFHNSSDREALLVLQNTATNEHVRLTECDVCHTLDENGTALDNFDQHGHGAFGVTCDGCHGTAHIFGTAPRLKSQLAEDTTSQSSVSNEYLNSNCLHCHELHAPHVFAADGPHPAGQASCIDCHDQHGTTVADGTNTNDTMIRLSVLGEPTLLPEVGTPYDGDWYVSGRNDAVCDNAACHSSITTGLGTDHGADSGGTISPADLAGCASSVGCHSTHDSPQFGRGADCDTCHAVDNGRDHGAGGQNGAGESLAAHDRHTGNTAYYASCAACHAHDGTTVAPGVGVHNDGTVNFGGPYMTSAFDYGPDGAADFAAVADSCATAANGCHDGAGTDWAADSLGTAPTSCQKCHDAGTPGEVDAGKILDTGGYPPPSGRHADHFASDFYVPDPECDSCHGTNATTGGQLGHKNAATTFAQAMSSYTAANGDCTNTCHDVVPGSFGDWNDGAGLGCQNCHGAGLSLDRGWPPNLGAHTAHTGNTGGYVAGNCVDCHNDNTVTHSLFDGTVTSPTLGAKVSAWPLNGSCTNTCHLAGEAGDWTGGSAAIACTDCHQGTYIGGGTNGPVSGLHATAAGTMLSGNPHDASFADGNAGTATCETCHTAAPSTGHVTGTVVGTEANFAADVNYADGTPETCGPGGTLSTCHEDGGAWARRWSNTADDAAPANCANCHGDFASEFVTGMVARHETTASGDPGGEIVANHGGGTRPCYQCHNYDAALNQYEGGFAFSTRHQDGTIQLNSNNGFVDGGAEVYCDGCHTTPYGTGDGGHSFTDTQTGDGLGVDRWARTLEAGPAGDCAGCHAANVPNFHSDATESQTVHDAHFASGYITQCNDCHINNGPGGAGHNNGTVEFGGTYMAATADYSRATGFGGGCLGTVNGCHDSDGTEWSAAGGLDANGDGCQDCHLTSGKMFSTGATDFVPVTGLHAVTNITPHDQTLPSSGCISCHGYPNPGPAHRNGSYQDTSPTTWTWQATLSYDPAVGCTAACHGGLGDAWNRRWIGVVDQVPGALDNPGDPVCDNCHGDFTNGWRWSEAHATTTDHTDPYGPNGSDQMDKHGVCQSCHGWGNANYDANWGAPSANNGHGDGFITMNGPDVTPGPAAGAEYNDTTWGCEAACHSNALVMSDSNWPVNYGDFGSGDCDTCHSGAPYFRDHTDANENAANHLAHANNAGYVTNCADCHSHDGLSVSPLTGIHGDGTVNFKASGSGGLLDSSLDYSVAGFANTNCLAVNGCHDSDAGEWASGTLGADGCVDCHLATAKVLSQAPTSGLHTGPLTISANPHDDNFNDGNAGTANCETCHGTTPSSAHVTGTLSGAEANFLATVGYTDGVPETCGPNGGLASCHDDGGAWARRWSTTAKLSTGEQCDNCHGQLATATDGVVPRHRDGQTASSHNGCQYCHGYQSGDVSWYDIDADHRNGTLDVNVTGTGFVDHGATVGCSNCHAADDDADDSFSDGEHEFQEASNSGGLGRWARLDTGGPSVSCTSCHQANITAFHSGATESQTTHDLHTGSNYFTNCNNCHAHNGPGSTGDAVHDDGTVNFGGTYIDAGSNFDKTLNFDGTCAATNGCHDEDGGEWAAGTLGADRCVDCHATTGKLFSSANPSSGLHTGTPTISGNTHDDNFDNGAAGPAGCETCHTASPSSGHIGGGAVNPAEVFLAATVGYTDGTPETCGPNGALSTCHDDGGAWARRWDASANAAAPANCANCHGDFTAGFVGGMVARHETATSGDPGGQILANHGGGTRPCYQCHNYDASVNQYEGGFAFTTRHRDGNVQLNSNNSFTDPAATDGEVYCDGCHTTPYGTADGGHSFTDAESGDGEGVDRWTRVLEAGPAGDCNGCHAANVPAFHSNATESQTMHDAHTGSGYTSQCSDCHLNDGPGGTGHNNGTVEFSGYITTAADYDRTIGFGGSCLNTVNGCHDEDGGEWATGSLGADACADCHLTSGKLFSTANPSSGLHTGTPTISGNTHDESFDNGAAGPAGCETCHTANPSSGHIGGGAVNPAEVTIFADVGYTDGTPETCGPGGTLSACHDDGGAWARRWDTSANAAAPANCANCHGDFTAGFVGGMVARHETATSGDPGGQILANHGGATKPCYQCHNYDATVNQYEGGFAFTTRHRDGNILLNDNNGFVDAGAQVQCDGCHTTPYGTLDGQHSFTDAATGDGLGVDRWTRVLEAGPAGDCAGCHAANITAFHSGATENQTMHDAHTGSGYTTQCSDCHLNNGPGGTGHNNGTVEFGGTYMTTNGIDYARTAGFGGTCAATNGCHDEDGSEWAAGTLGADSCQDCHGATTKYLGTTNGFSGYDPTSNDHAAHLGNSAFVPQRCGNCHGANAELGTHTGHMANDGIDVDTSGTGVNKITAWAAPNCTNNCHNPASFSWTTGTIACNNCHTATGKDLYVSADVIGPVTPPASGEHAIHVASDTFVPNNCTDCHTHSGALTVAAHADGSYTTGSQITPASYNNTTGQCTNTCHLVDAAAAGDWLDAGELQCSQCHDATGKTLNAYAFPPVQGAHATHVAETDYVAANCVDCHNDNGVTHSTMDNLVTSPTLGSQITAFPGDGSCTNSCHLAGQAGDWTGGAAAITCTDCHSGTYIGGGVNGPSSGLHDLVPTVSGVTHDDAFGAGADCASCHTSAPSSAHLDAVFDQTIGAAGNTAIAFDADVGYSDAATPTCAPVGALASCHTDAGAWQRLWLETAEANTGAECAGCHGDWVRGWNAGVTHRTESSGDLINTHAKGTNYECVHCHALEGTGYTFTSGTGDWNAAAGETSNHGDGLITVNADPAHTFGRNGTGLSGCAPCHAQYDGATAPNHSFTTTSWTLSTVDGDVIDAGCDSCHGYPPLASGDPNAAQYANSAVEDYSFGGGAHGVNGHVPFGAVASDAWGPCGVCHAGGASHAMTNPVSSNRANVTVLVDAAREMRDTSAGNDTVYNGDPTVDGTYKTCDNISCHYGLSPDWAMRAQCTPTGTISTTYPTNGGSVVQNSSITITTSITGVTPGTEQYSVDGGAWTSIATAWNSGTARNGVTVQTRGLDSGCGTIYVYSAVNTFDVIACSPTGTISTTYPANGGTVPQNQSITVTVSAAGTDPGTEQYSVDGGAWTSIATAWNSGTARNGVTIQSRATDSVCGVYVTSAVNTFDVISIVPYTSTESFETGFVDWVNTTATGDNDDWSRQTGANVDSNNTGPTAMGAVDGSWYVYTEVSNGADTNTFDLLHNATLNGTTHGDMQIRFNYHMYGSNMGTLNLDISTTSNFSSGVTTLWTLTTDQGDQWFEATVDIPGATYPGDYWLRFRGLGDGGGFAGDRTLDLITVTNEGLPAPPSGTGGGVATACDTCHEFGPNDDSLDANGHPTSPASAEYTYSAPGDHQAHGMGDAGTPANPTAADAAGLCDKCHPAAVTGYTNSHSNGTVELRTGTIGRADGSDNGTWNGSTCSNVNCHANGVTPVWGSGTTNCTSCHQYPPTTVGTNHNTTTGNGTIGETALRAAHEECSLCHGTSAATPGDPNSGMTSTPKDLTGDGGDAYDPATMHGDGLVQLNGISVPDDGQSAEYNETSTGCAAACHPESWQFATVQTNTVQTLEFGGGACDACHKAGGVGSIVTAGSPHVSLTVGGPAAACEACHPGGTKGAMHAKSGDANVALIANNSTVGVEYISGTTPNYNGDNGVVLGGDNTTGTTEAEICWNCHNGLSIDEWGTNTDTNGGAPNYDFGSLNQRNWVGATWTSAQALFSYKSGAIQSTHAASSGGVSGLDAVANIRCSYCHDVHDTAGAKGVPGTDPNGAPFLRGTWMGNPYAEDGAPRAGTNYTNLTGFGQVPRGLTSANQMGGFWIDQNSGNPDSAWTQDGASGLCERCHGDGNGTWSGTELDDLNTFGTASTDWVGTNGHSAVLIGATGTHRANIFSNTIRNPTGTGTSRSGVGPGNPTMAYRNLASDRGYGFRSNSGDPEGWNRLPPVNPNGEPYAMQRYNWGATVDSTTIDVNYHTWTCSKCHNPHASRLPRLMITNCLDTNHNTWDTQASPYSVQTLPAEGTQNSDRGSSISQENGNGTTGGLPASNWTSAQNCHRKRDPAFQNNTGDGWNNVTPW